MHVGLIDVDSHNFPNLVLMKLSAWHKEQGDTVELLKPDDVLKGMNLFQSYDKLIGACVFDWNKGLAEQIESIGAHVAGTGTGKAETLPDEIEHIMPDYSLYGIDDTAGNVRGLRIMIQIDIPMPESCVDCPMCVIASYSREKYYCIATLDYIDIGEWVDKRKPNCPIVEVAKELG